jgi:hypothetical protein
MGAAFSESKKQLPGDDRLDAGRDALGGAVTVDDGGRPGAIERSGLRDASTSAPINRAGSLVVVLVRVVARGGSSCVVLDRESAHLWTLRDRRVTRCEV